MDIMRALRQTWENGVNTQTQHTGTQYRRTAHGAKQDSLMHPITLVFYSQDLESDLRTSSRTTPVFTGMLVFAAVVLVLAWFICSCLGQSAAILPTLPALFATGCDLTCFQLKLSISGKFTFLPRYRNISFAISIGTFILLSNYVVNATAADHSDLKATCLRICGHANGILALSIHVVWYARHAHICEKVLKSLMIPVVHIIFPSYNLAPNEEAIHFIAYVLVGHCIGYVVELLDRTIFIKQQLRDGELQQLATVNACIDEVRPRTF
eukprot:2286041-Pleurochrysis_carterae.AAC.1